MNTKRNFDNIKIFCKGCNQEMIIESERNNNNAILFCPKCSDRVSLKIHNFKDL